MGYIMPLPTPSPLRYPGGKTVLKKCFVTIIDNNNLQKCAYAEPYAGGSGLALSLLFDGYVSEIHLNDLNHAVASFWKVILNETQSFIDKIIATNITVAEHDKQKHILNDATSSEFDIAFAFFFINRTHRSGIINAGIIGGLHQTGKYKIDCRFNKTKLIQKIQTIADYKDKIHIYNDDAEDFIQKMDKTLPTKSIFYIDPPYYEKGKSLYMNYYHYDDHAKIANIIQQIKNHWVLTYDDATVIQNLYQQNHQIKFDLNYSAYHKRRASELMIFSNNLQLPTPINA